MADNISLRASMRVSLVFMMFLKSFMTAEKSSAGIGRVINMNTAPIIAVNPSR